MKLYDIWMDKLKTGGKNAVNAFLDIYYEAETAVYKQILAEKAQTYTGTALAFGEKYGLKEYQIAGFIDGINTSLTQPISLEDLEDTTEITLEIDWKQLYINMIKAKADWLQNLEEWNNIYSEEERAQIAKEYRASRQAVSTKVGRNDPCPCGSGRKYKNCCMP